NFYLPLLGLVTSSPFPLDFQILPRFSPLGPLKLLSSPEGGLNVPRMYKSKFKKSRRTSPQRVSSSSFHQPLSKVNDNATDPVPVNEEGPSTSKSVATASIRPPAAVVKPSAFRPQQIPQPKGIKRKSI